MPAPDTRNLLNNLIAATTPDAVRAVLDALGDHADVDLDKPFGPFGLCWHAYGNNLSNISSIGLATKPGRSLTERITNATDAILEDQVRPGVTPPRSPREAARQWFGRPVSGPEDGLFKWEYEDHGYDRRISVVITDSGDKAAPTVDVVDDGTGISPDRFPNTILSLQGSNKIDKRYVVGTFGQGGASTLKFCDYALIVSRHKDDPGLVGFTVIRVLRLGGEYKEDCYGYLALHNATGGHTLLSCPSDGPLNLYPNAEGARAPELKKGTLVRHVGYRLPKLENALHSSPGNLWHYLQYSAFDPLLPFRVIDLREGRRKNEVVRGSRNRLMRLATEKAEEPEEDETGSQLRHHRPMEFFTPHGSAEPSIGIEYWVVLNYHKTKGLRSHSNELFVPRGYPVVGTMNGQNQGELTAQVFRDAGLNMVARHAVVHIDATKADSRVRRDLFSTNREGFVDGPVLTSLVQHLEKMIDEDDTLEEIERELTEKLAQRESKSTSEEVKRQVQRLLQDAGLQVREEGEALVPGEGDLHPVSRAKRKPPRKPSPLPTLPYPEVTKFAIVAPRQKMRVHINDSETVLVETDADSRFDTEGRVAVRAEPNKLEQAGKAPLTGGRVRWRLRPREDAKAGDTGKIIATITKPDGGQLASEIEFEVLAAKEEKSKKAKGVVPPFDIIPIHPTDDAERWNYVWPDLGEGASAEDQAAVAYKPDRAGGKITVYYSTVFAPFRDQVERLVHESAALSVLFRTNYEVWIGYHAILQENSRSEVDTGSDQAAIEEAMEAERTRVARMQVRQARETAQLMHRAMREKTEAE